MAEKTDDLILSVSMDLATVQRALKRLENSVASASSNVVKQFDAMGKGADKGIITALQARIDAMTGVGVKATKEWNGALADQGKELERLRAKYSPLFAVLSQYKATIADIRQAHAVGALSSAEYQAAMSKERQAALATTAAIKGRNAAMEMTPKVASPQMARGFETANITAQLQDIAVTSAMGMNPLMIALQQGTQISGAISQMENPVRGLAAAFTSLVSPASLATIGIVAVGAAAIQYAATAGKKIPTVDEILQRHQRNIEALGPAYQKIAAEQAKYIKQSPDFAATDALDNAKNSADRLMAEAKAAFGKIKSASEFQDPMKAIFGGGDRAGFLRFSGAKEAIDAFGKSIEESKPKVIEFRAAIEALEKSGKLSPDAAKELREFAEKAKIAEEDLRPVIALTSELARAGADLTTKLTDTQAQFVNLAATGVISEEQKQQIDDIIGKFQEGKLTANQAQTSLAAVADAVPAASSYISALSPIFAALGQLMVRANAAGESLAGVAGSRPVMSETDARKQYQASRRTAALAVNKGTDLVAEAERRKNLTADQLRLEEAIDRVRSNAEKNGAYLSSDQAKLIAEVDIEGDKLRAAAGKKPKAAPAIKKTAEDRFTADLQAIRDRTSALQQEMQLIGLSNQEAIKRRTALSLEQSALADLREEARKKGQTDLDSIKLSADKIAAINRESEAYASQAEALRRAEEANELTKDVTKSFVQDLLKGESAASSFASALYKIADKLLNDVLDAMLQVNAAGAGGGGRLGNILGGIGSIFGGGQAGLARSGKIAGMFASGGYTGAGGKYEPAGIVHKGEFVMNAEATRRIGIDKLRMLQGYSTGGFVGALPVPSPVAPRMPAMPQPVQKGGGNSVTLAPVYHIDATGADQAAVTRLEAGLAKRDREFTDNVKKAVIRLQNGRFL